MRTEPARSKVKKALGEFWRPGKFRGYALESLEDAAMGSERRARSSYFQVYYIYILYISHILQLTPQEQQLLFPGLLYIQKYIFCISLIAYNTTRAERRAENQCQR